MERIEAIKRIIEQLNDELVICNLGFPSRELYSIKDSPKHFYMLGSMGMASSIGLGLALSQKRKVIVLEGDGSLLMNLGSLVTIHAQAPKNLILIILDNGCYATTSSQCTYALQVDLSKLAKGIGFQKIFKFENPQEINMKKVLREEGPVIVHVKVEPGNANVPIIDISPEEIISRFMDEI
ncbi:MAG TPA: sulfopyruvate decarboxylase subunit beta [Methanothermobacter sp.]|mgnify:FL=1|nr:sulfopyruvate decarboxylase subunit beta [Methanothermobacter sp.]